MTNIDIFTDLADKYGNSINTTKEAEVFFDEFMAMTGGMVIVDFLDCDNDDHIEKIVFDHNEGLMTLYTRLPEKDPEQRLLIKSVLPFDTDCYLVDFTSELVKCGKPTHLFTFEEIEELMRNADDSFNNKLVIDEDGTAHILQNPHLGCLYPVSIETWCAGNGYVGPASSLSEALPSYHLCLQLWLHYLMTGKRQYDDAYVFVDEEEIINKLQMYY